jgi:hypothetical protein
MSLLSRVKRTKSFKQNKCQNEELKKVIVKQWNKKRKL